MTIRDIQIKAQGNAVAMPQFANILIVDDHRFDRTRLRRLCFELEFEVRIAEADSLESFGTALELDTYDLIFLDYHLPDGNGLQALNALKTDPKNRLAATIMITGDKQADVAIKAMKEGCSDYIVKDDLSAEAVRRAAVNALQKSQLSQGLETQEVLRRRVEMILDDFAKECVFEIKPMLSRMMRLMRDLNAVRNADEAQFDEVMGQIEKTCARLFEFLNDIGDHDQKADAMGDFGLNPLDDEPVSAAAGAQGPAPEPAPAVQPSSRLFGRFPKRAAQPH